MSMSVTGGAVVMMKMTSSTKHKSSSGVMFSSVRVWCLFAEYFFMLRGSGDLRFGSRLDAFQSVGDFLGDGTIVHVLVLDRGRVLGGEVVELLRDCADQGDHIVIG